MKRYKLKKAKKGLEKVYTVYSNGDLDIHTEFLEVNDVD